MAVIYSFDSAGYLAEFTLRHHVKLRVPNPSGEEAR